MVEQWLTVNYMAEYGLTEVPICGPYEGQYTATVAGYFKRKMKFDRMFNLAIHKRCKELKAMRR